MFFLLKSSKKFLLPGRVYFKKLHRNVISVLLSCLVQSSLPCWAMVVYVSMCHPQNDWCLMGDTLMINADLRVWFNNSIKSWYFSCCTRFYMILLYLLCHHFCGFVSIENNNNSTFFLSLRVLYDTFNTPELKCKYHFINLWYNIILENPDKNWSTRGVWLFIYTYLLTEFFSVNPKKNIAMFQLICFFKLHLV